MKIIKKNIPLSFIVLIGLLLLKFEVFSRELMLSNSDSTKSFLLDEVQVLSKKIEIFETEQPKRKKQYSFITIAPCQIGMLFNHENLIGKIPRKLEVYFDKRNSPNYIFQIQIYSIGKDSLPLDLLNKQELAFSSYKIGWNELPLKLDYLTIPKNGIALIVNFFAKSKFNNEETDRIAMGKYSTTKRFFLRTTSQNDWLLFTAFQDGKVGPMMRLIAGN